MKKIVVTMLIFSLMFILSVSSVFAFSNAPDIDEFNLFIESIQEPTELEYDEYTDFAITSGLEKDTNLTFDSSRTVFGETLADTKVVIDVYLYDREQESFIHSKEYAIEVGASGIFSESIPLSLGKNYISITATYDNFVAKKTSVMKRKDLEIKYELERGIVFPGRNLPSMLF